MNLKFKVNKQIITRLDSERVVADSKNYLYAEFQFSEEWTGTKTAIFKNGNTSRSVLLDGNNKCLVPWEVIKKYEFTVSVFCGSLVTANVIGVNVEASGYSSSEASQTPTSTVYEQIISMLEDISQGEVSEEVIEEIVTDYMEEHPIDLSGYATETYVNNAVNNINLSGYAQIGHNHNDIYYTETEVDNLLGGKSDTSHNHSGVYQPIEVGKGLSTNDFTTAEKNKLEGISAGAEVNVNADWNAVSGDAQILNKPSIPSKTSDLTNDSGFLTAHQDISGKESTSNKVTSISSSSTDTQYPSAKCVYDLIGDVETLLGGLL